MGRCRQYCVRERGGNKKEVKEQDHQINYLLFSIKSQQK